MMAEYPQFFMFERHLTACAWALTLASAGSNIAARIAMIAITTNSSISVKAFRRLAVRCGV